MKTKRLLTIGSALMALLMASSAPAYDDTSRASDRMALQAPANSGRNDDFAIQYYFSRPKAEENTILNKFMADGQALESLIFKNTLTAKTIDLKVAYLTSSISSLREMDSERFFSGKEFHSLKNVYDRLYKLLPKGHPFRYLDLQVPDLNIRVPDIARAVQSEINTIRQSSRIGDTKTLRNHLTKDLPELKAAFAGLTEQIVFYRSRSKEIITEILKLRTYIAECGNEVMPERIRFTGDTITPKPFEDAKYGKPAAADIDKQNDKDAAMQKNNDAQAVNIGDNGTGRPISSGSENLPDIASEAYSDTTIRHPASLVKNLTSASGVSTIEGSYIPSPEELLKLPDDMTPAVKARILNIISDLAVMNAKKIELSTAGERFSLSFNIYDGLFSALPEGFGVSALSRDDIQAMSDEAAGLLSEYNNAIALANKDYDILMHYSPETAGSVSAVLSSPSVTSSDIDKLINKADVCITAYNALIDKASDKISEIQAAILTKAGEAIAALNKKSADIDGYINDIAAKKTAFEEAYENYQKMLSGIPLPPEYAPAPQGTVTVTGNFTVSIGTGTLPHYENGRLISEYINGIKYIYVGFDNVGFAYDGSTDPIRSAINMAEKGDVIIVKSGLYTGDIEMTASQSANIYGGFDETGHRNISTSGNVTRGGITEIQTQPDSTIIDGNITVESGAALELSYFNIPFGKTVTIRGTVIASNIGSAADYYVVSGGSFTLGGYSSFHDLSNNGGKFTSGIRRPGQISTVGDAIKQVLIEYSQAEYLIKVMDSLAEILGVNKADISALPTEQELADLAAFFAATQSSIDSNKQELSDLLSKDPLDYNEILAKLDEPLPDLDRVNSILERYDSVTASIINKVGELSEAITQKAGRALEMLKAQSDIIQRNTAAASAAISDLGTVSTRIDEIIKTMQALGVEVPPEMIINPPAPLETPVTRDSLSQTILELQSAINNGDLDAILVIFSNNDLKIDIAEPSSVPGNLATLVSNTDDAMKYAIGWLSARTGYLAEITEVYKSYKNNITAEAGKKVEAYLSFIQRLDEAAGAVLSKKSEFDDAYGRYSDTVSIIKGYYDIAIPEVTWQEDAANINAELSAIAGPESHARVYSLNEINSIRTALEKNPPDYLAVVGLLKNNVPDEVNTDDLSRRYDAILTALNAGAAEIRDAVQRRVDDAVSAYTADQARLSVLMSDGGELSSKQSEFARAYQAYRGILSGLSIAEEYATAPQGSVTVTDNYNINIGSGTLPHYENGRLVSEYIDGVKHIYVGFDNAGFISSGNANPIQSAIDMAEKGDVIIVKGGTYTGNLDIPGSKSVNIYGGFDGSGKRDASAHPTIINGDLNVGSDSLVELNRLNFSGGSTITIKSYGQVLASNMGGSADCYILQHATLYLKGNNSFGSANVSGTLSFGYGNPNGPFKMDSNGYIYVSTIGNPEKQVLIEMTPDEYNALVLAYLADNFGTTPADITALPSQQEIDGMSALIASAESSLADLISALNAAMGQNPPKYADIPALLNSPVPERDQILALMARYDSAINALNDKTDELSSLIILKANEALAMLKSQNDLVKGYNDNASSLGASLNAINVRIDDMTNALGNLGIAISPIYVTPPTPLYTPVTQEALSNIISALESAVESGNMDDIMGVFANTDFNINIGEPSSSPANLLTFVQNADDTLKFLNGWFTNRIGYLKELTVVHIAVKDLAERIRASNGEITLVSVNPAPDNKDDYLVQLSGRSEVYTYTVKSTGYGSSSTEFIIDNVKHADGSTDRYGYNQVESEQGTLLRLANIEQYDASGNNTATISYLKWGNGSSNIDPEPRIQMIMTYYTGIQSGGSDQGSSGNDGPGGPGGGGPGPTGSAGSVKYTDFYSYNDDGSGFVVSRYTDAVADPSDMSKFLCQFTYIGEPWHEKLQECVLSDGTRITYDNELAQAVYANSGGEPIAYFTYTYDSQTNAVTGTKVTYRDGSEVNYAGQADPVEVAGDYTNAIIAKANEALEMLNSQNGIIERCNSDAKPIQSELSSISSKIDETVKNMQDLGIEVPDESIIHPPLVYSPVTQYTLLQTISDLQSAINSGDIEAIMTIFANEDLPIDIGSPSSVPENLATLVSNAETMLGFLSGWLGSRTGYLDEITGIYDSYKNNIVLQAGDKIKEHEANVADIQTKETEYTASEAAFEAVLNQYIDLFFALPEGSPFQWPEWNDPENNPVDHSDPTAAINDAISKSSDEISILTTAVMDKDYATIAAHIGITVSEVGQAMNELHSLIDMYDACSSQFIQEMTSIKSYLDQEAALKIVQLKTNIDNISAKKASILNKADQYATVSAEYRLILGIYSSVAPAPTSSGTLLTAGAGTSSLTSTGPITSPGIINPGPITISNPGLVVNMPGMPPTQAMLDALITSLNNASNMSTTEKNILSAAVTSTPPDYATICAHLGVKVTDAGQYDTLLNTYIKNYNAAITSIENNTATMKSYIAGKANNKIAQLQAGIADINNKEAEEAKSEADFNAIFAQYNSLFTSLPEGSPFQMIDWPAPIDLSTVIDAAHTKSNSEISALTQALSDGNYTVIAAHLGVAVAEVGQAADGLNSLINTYKDRSAQLACETSKIANYVSVINKKTEFEALYQQYSANYAALAQQGNVQPLDVSGLPSQQDTDNLLSLIVSGQASADQINAYFNTYDSFIGAANAKISEVSNWIGSYNNYQAAKDAFNASNSACQSLYYTVQYQYGNWSMSPADTSPLPGNWDSLNGSSQQSDLDNVTAGITNAKNNMDNKIAEISSWIGSYNNYQAAKDAFNASNSACQSLYYTVQYQYGNWSMSPADTSPLPWNWDSLNGSSQQSDLDNVTSGINNARSNIDNKIAEMNNWINNYYYYTPPAIDWNSFNNAKSAYDSAYSQYQNLYNSYSWMGISSLDTSSQPQDWQISQAYQQSDVDALTSRYNDLTNGVNNKISEINSYVSNYYYYYYYTPPAVDWTYFNNAKAAFDSAYSQYQSLYSAVQGYSIAGVDTMSQPQDWEINQGYSQGQWYVDSLAGRYNDLMNSVNNKISEINSYLGARDAMYNAKATYDSLYSQYQSLYNSVSGSGISGVDTMPQPQDWEVSNAPYYGTDYMNGLTARYNDLLNSVNNKISEINNYIGARDNLNNTKAAFDSLYSQYQNIYNSVSGSGISGVDTMSQPQDWEVNNAPYYGTDYMNGLTARYNDLMNSVNNKISEINNYIYNQQQMQQQQQQYYYQPYVDWNNFNNAKASYDSAYSQYQNLYNSVSGSGISGVDTMSLPQDWEVGMAASQGQYYVDTLASRYNDLTNNVNNKISEINSYIGARDAMYNAKAAFDSLYSQYQNLYNSVSGSGISGIDTSSQPQDWEVNQAQSQGTDYMAGLANRYNDLANNVNNKLTEINNYIAAQQQMQQQQMQQQAASYSVSISEVKYTASGDYQKEDASTVTISTGAAATKMMLDYMIDGAIQDGASVSRTDPSAIANISDPYQMTRYINEHDPYDDNSFNSTWLNFYNGGGPEGGNPYKGYNFGTEKLGTFDEAIKTLCHWIGNQVTKGYWAEHGELVAHAFTPALVPLDGSFEHWVLVTGFTANESPNADTFNTPADFMASTVSYFDPLNGNSLITKTIDQFALSYQPINGSYYQIDEPPLENSELTAKKPEANKELSDKTKESVAAKVGVSVSDIKVTDVSDETQADLSGSQEKVLNITLDTGDITVKLSSLGDPENKDSFILRSAVDNKTGTDLYLTAMKNVGEALGSLEFNTSDWSVDQKEGQAKFAFSLNDDSAKVDAKVSTTTGYMQEIEKRVEGKNDQGVLISRTVDSMIYGSDGKLEEECHKESTAIDSNGNVLEEKVKGVKHASGQTYEETVKYDTSGNVVSKDTGANSGNTEFMEKAAVESTVVANAADKRFASEMKIEKKSSAMPQK